MKWRWGSVEVPFRRCEPNNSRERPSTITLPLISLLPRLPHYRAVMIVVYVVLDIRLLRSPE